MNAPINWIFFCTREDYPKFLKLVPAYPLFRSTYEAFVQATDEQIKHDAQRQIRKKVTVAFSDFSEYRNLPENKGQDDLFLLHMFTHRSSK